MCSLLGNKTDLIHNFFVLQKSPCHRGVRERNDTKHFMSLWFKLPPLYRRFLFKLVWYCYSVTAVPGLWWTGIKNFETVKRKDTIRKPQNGFLFFLQLRRLSSFATVNSAILSYRSVMIARPIWIQYVQSTLRLSWKAGCSHFWILCCT